MPSTISAKKKVCPKTVPNPPLPLSWFEKTPCAPPPSLFETVRSIQPIKSRGENSCVLHGEGTNSQSTNEPINNTTIDRPILTAQQVTHSYKRSPPPPLPPPSPPPYSPILSSAAELEQHCLSFQRYLHITLFIPWWQTRSDYFANRTIKKKTKR